MTQLSKNFSLSELTYSSTAVNKGIDNTPTPEVIASLQILVDNVLQPIREQIGKPIKISSGYRSPAVNASVGGSTNSDHCRGQAADIEIAGMANGALAKWIKDNLKFTQLILEFYTQGVPDSGWVHVSYNPNDLKCQVLTAVKQNGKTVYLNGIQI
jgi:zinc D-Ala-D-Ala carboxypeptidase